MERSTHRTGHLYRMKDSRAIKKIINGNQWRQRLLGKTKIRNKKLANGYMRLETDYSGEKLSRRLRLSSDKSCGKVKFRFCSPSYDLPLLFINFWRSLISLEASSAVFCSSWNVSMTDDSGFHRSSILQLKKATPILKLIKVTVLVESSCFSFALRKSPVTSQVYAASFCIIYQFILLFTFLGFPFIITNLFYYSLPNLTKTMY